MTTTKLIAELQSRISCGCILEKDQVRILVPHPGIDHGVLEFRLHDLKLTSDGPLLVGKSDPEQSAKPKTKPREPN
ncbi:MAG: hypothetical protein JWM59_4103 [Verrucomicrobiales bacterium]|nr:hypothetical protein [Verrucomicrobiales bacterium]